MLRTLFHLIVSIFFLKNKACDFKPLICEIDITEIIETKYYKHDFYYDDVMTKTIVTVKENESPYHSNIFEHTQKFSTMNLMHLNNRNRN